MEDFKKWLISKKNFGAKSATDSVSRLKRGQAILGNAEVNSKSVDEVKDREEFEKLSVSVKSQIRRAIKLYIEFLNSEK